MKKIATYFQNIVNAGWFVKNCSHVFENKNDTFSRESVLPKGPLRTATLRSAEIFAIAQETAYLDRFLDDMKDQNNGDVVFVATTVGDYKKMTINNQEIRRYIRELGEVIVYYRDVTLPNGQKGVGVEIESTKTN